ncbi:hypothetical protein [Pediococcus argentinicus]|uniref:Uncharacterized protein n=1 Tax=Pediococcus argentinicus TaxID=480391 RepID=A0A0R2NI43_9LACO|nr:hypothetical protein [Pediococcus argentinicus]KRO25471.1 hypothetical protein IV88_GL001721 [Pediococcus argentinicus]NKZ22165.1 hypothetical protein [Pediococcus argentinicus]GEP19214.1 hypothetical protein LSA03_05980 [Pediococcus argentinicus]
MSEEVFFNPGDSIGNFHDYNEAVRSGQIFKHKDTEGKELVVVSDPQKHEEYAIFFVNDMIKKSTTDEGKNYLISKKI